MALLNFGTAVIIVVAATILVIAALLIFIASRPSEFRIERTADVGVPPDVVFSIINDFHQWHRWSPWEKLDPAMKKTYDGPAAGPGSIHIWSGNKKVGEGRNTILDSKAGEYVRMKLEMFRPFACTNQVTFKLVPAGENTRVSWIMEGKNAFIPKAFCMVMNMDRMVGKDFEAGLANLNAAAQADLQGVK
jgi:hypothetical protein